MTEYTPSMEEIRGIYAAYGYGGNRPHDGQHQGIREWRAEFDRWLAAHDREVAAAAWWEGVQAQWKHRPLGNRLLPAVNPYREGRTDA